MHPLALAIGLVAAIDLSMVPWTSRWPTAVRLVLAFALAAVPMMFTVFMIESGPAFQAARTFRRHAPPRQVASVSRQ